MKKTNYLSGNENNPSLKKAIRIMKLTCFLFMIPLLSIWAEEGYSQTKLLNVSMSNTTVKEVLTEIENQSEFYFMYSSKLIDANRLVSVNIKDQKLKQALSLLFAGTNVTYTVKDKIIVLTTPEIINSNLLSALQQVSISGKVTDNAGQPMIGVTILVKGTTKGAVTDSDGKFVIADVPADATLVFSTIGMKTVEIVVGTQTTIDVVMEEDLVGLEEVVVVGYGTMKKSDLTGAVARADLKALENSSSVNVIEGLKGIVPGLNIGNVTKAGDNPTISIRGRNSISGTTSPLIVLDGIIYHGNFTDINPSDIESVDVLKDASSAAIYGSQGANGVLLITTKTTTKMSKPIIEYSGNYSRQSLINQDMERLDRDGFLNQLADVYISRSRTGDDLLERDPDFDVTSLFRDENVSAGYAAGTDVDWWNLLSEPNPYVQNHNLSLRGMNDLSSYFVSFGYTDQQNMVINDTYKRYNLRINLDAKITDWLKIGTQSFYTVSDFSGANIGFSSLCYLPALITPYNENGTLKEQVYLGGTNPLLTINNPDKDTRNTLTGNFYTVISVPWIKGLSYRMNYSNSLVSYKTYNFNPYATSGLGSGSKYLANQNEWTFDNIVTYQRDFGLHSVNGTFVYGVEQRNYENTRAVGATYTDKSLYYNRLQAGQTDLNIISSDAWKENSLYTMARGVYSYNSRYIFTGTVRRDGFSGFGGNYKFGVFPSAAVAWRISEEDFLRENLPFVDNLKLRYSYGVGGNRTVARYETQAKMSANLPSDDDPNPDVNEGGYLYGDGATGGLTQAMQTMANSNLRWETTNSSNMGFDFSVLHGRVFGNYEYYISHTYDLIYRISIPVMNGTFATSVPTNIGELKNIGHEISVTGIPVRTNDFEWAVTGNFSTNKNEVVTILGYDADGDGKEDDLVSSNIFIGEPLGTIYNYEITGMWQVEDYNEHIIPSGFTYGTYKIADLDTSGTINAENDRKILGYEDPLFRFSIQNTFRYKGFELKVSIYSVQGGKNHYLGQPARRLQIPDHLTNNSYFKFDYWTPENPDAKYRQLGYYTPALGQEFSPYVSRSFVRLQELSLAYNFSSELLKKIKVQKARIWVSCTNLLTLTKWDGWDPEANQGLTYDLQTSTDGTDQYTGYPTMKGYNVGVNFEF